MRIYLQVFLQQKRLQSVEFKAGHLAAGIDAELDHLQSERKALTDDQLSIEPFIEKLRFPALVPFVHFLIVRLAVQPMKQHLKPFRKEVLLEYEYHLFLADQIFPFVELLQWPQIFLISRIDNEVAHNLLQFRNDVCPDELVPALRAEHRSPRFEHDFGRIVWIFQWLPQFQGVRELAANLFEDRL